MTAWAKNAREQRPEQFSALLIPMRLGDELLFLEAEGGNQEGQWVALAQLDRAQRKAVRYDYNQWFQELNVTFGEGGGDVGRTNDSWLGEIPLRALNPESVQLFGRTDSVESKKWKIAWGLDLNNFKQNHLEPYATREVVGELNEGRPHNMTNNAIQMSYTVKMEEQDDAKEAAASDKEDIPMERWFIANRKLLTAFAFLLLLVGFLDRYVF